MNKFYNHKFITKKTLFTFVTCFETNFIYHFIVEIGFFYDIQTHQEHNSPTVFSKSSKSMCSKSTCDSQKYLQKAHTISLSMR